MNEDIVQLKNQLRSIQSQIQILESRARQTWSIPNVPEPIKTKLQMTVEQDAHGFSVGKVVRLSNGGWVASQADDADNAAVVGVVIVVVDENKFVIATPGSYVTGLSGLTNGVVHYLSATSAGDLTTTKPTIAVPIIIPDSTTSGFLLSVGTSSDITSPTAPGQVFSSFNGSDKGWNDNLILGSSTSEGGSEGKLDVVSKDGAISANASGLVQISAVSATKKPKLYLQDTAGGRVITLDTDALAANTEVRFRTVTICKSGTTKTIVILSSDA